MLNESGEGYKIMANIPIDNDETGYLHYKSMVSTLGGSLKIEYPPNAQYYEIKMDYRAPYGTIFGSVMLFMTVAFFVWGGLGVCLRMMVDDDSTGEAILEAEYVEEASS